MASITNEVTSPHSERGVVANCYYVLRGLQFWLTQGISEAAVTTSTVMLNRGGNVKLSGCLPPKYIIYHCWLDYSELVCGEFNLELSSSCGQICHCNNESRLCLCHTSWANPETGWDMVCTVIQLCWCDSLGWYQHLGWGMQTFPCDKFILP